MATLDFRSRQIRTSKVIASGSTGSGAKLLVYPVEAASDLSGSVNQSIFNTASIGTDVFLYVSGNIGGKNNSGVTVLGGDVVVSGSLYVSGPTLSRSNGPVLSFNLTNYAAVVDYVYTVVGQIIFNPLVYSESKVTFQAALAVSTSSHSASMKLWNITSASFVEIGGPGIATINTANTTPTVVTNTDLRTATGFTTSSIAIYELQLAAQSGSSAYVGGAEFRVTGS